MHHNLPIIGILNDRNVCGGRLILGIKYNIPALPFWTNKKKFKVRAVGD